MHRLLFSLFLIFVSATAYSQKAFKPVKAALKAKNYKEVLNLVGKLRQDSLYKADYQLCLYGIEAQKGLNDAENMKLYLKQNYDTVAFFSTTYAIVEEAVRLDSIEKELEMTAGRKPKQRNYVIALLRKYFPNVNVAARFFYKRRKFEEAMHFVRPCLDLPHTELGEAACLPTSLDTVNAVLYTISAYNAEKYDDVHRYEDLALSDSVARAGLYECFVYSAEALRDTTAYHSWLNTGWKTYPDKPVFFNRLIDYYVEHNDFTQVLITARKQLEVEPENVPAMLAKCLAHLNMMNFDQCIDEGLDLLKVDSANVEVNYYIGASYAAKALSIELPVNATKTNSRAVYQQQKGYFAQAEPYLERYRKLAPEAKDRWAPLLYKVYLGLNRGAKFSEIEKLLQ